MAYNYLNGQKPDIDSNEYFRTSYSNYNDSILERPAGVYAHGYDSTTSSPNSKRASAQIEAIGSKFLTAWSENVKLPPAVAATANSLSRRSSLHARAKSLVGLVPSSLHSGTVVERPSRPTATTRRKQSNMRLPSLLSRPSLLPQPDSESKEEDIAEDEVEDLVEYKPTFTATPTRSRLVRQTTPQSARTADTTKSFSWFRQTPTKSSTTQSSTPKRAQQDGPVIAGDDSLINLNVTSSLFPTGPADALQPTAFNDLLLNAQAVIAKLQDGYKAQTEALSASYAERDAQTEEVEEAETRARHLRSQLEDMARRAAEQEAAMSKLASELAAERQRSEAADHQHRQALDKYRSRSAEQDDDDATPRRMPGQRKSRNSDGVASDSGFESDADTSSTFSGPTTPMSSYSQMRLAPAIHDDEASIAWEGKTPTTATAPKGMDGMTSRPGRPKISTAVGREAAKGTDMLLQWGETDALKMENRRLVSRVRELEGVVEGCLSIVDLDCSA